MNHKKYFICNMDIPLILNRGTKLVPYYPFLV